jgi:hypothetical protein
LNVGKEVEAIKRLKLQSIAILFNRMNAFWLFVPSFDLKKDYLQTEYLNKSIKNLIFTASSYKI